MLEAATNCRTQLTTSLAPCTLKHKSTRNSRATPRLHECKKEPCASNRVSAACSDSARNSLQLLLPSIMFGLDQAFGCSVAIAVARRCTVRGAVSSASMCWKLQRIATLYILNSSRAFFMIREINLKNRTLQPRTTLSNLTPRCMRIPPARFPTS